MAYKNKQDQYDCQKRWYEKHKKQHIKNVKEDKREKASWLVNLKKTFRCLKCTENDFRCLDFHHRVPKDKCFNIGHAITLGFSKEKILEEIVKCDVLCKNCHAKITFHQNG